MPIDSRIEYLINQRTNELQGRIDAIHEELHDLRIKLEDLMTSKAAATRPQRSLSGTTVKTERR